MRSIKFEVHPVSALVGALVVLIVIAATGASQIQVVGPKPQPISIRGPVKVKTVDPANMVWIDSVSLPGASLSDGDLSIVPNSTLPIYQVPFGKALVIVEFTADTSFSSTVHLAEADSSGVTTTKLNRQAMAIGFSSGAAFPVGMTFGPGSEMTLINSSSSTTGNEFFRFLGYLVEA